MVSSFVEDELVRSRTLLSIESINVCPPPNRRNDLQCSIYGTASINDDPRTNVPITLYDRPIQNPQRITLALREFDSLSLSDGDSDRAIVASPSSHIYLYMKLYEKKSSGGDECIAIVDSFEFQAPFVNQICRVEVRGNHGFVFEVSYALVTGLRVKVEVRIYDLDLAPKIHEDEDEFYFSSISRGVKRDSAGQEILRKAPIWGHVGVFERFGGNPADITLHRRHDIEPMMVTMGCAIDLDRSVLVVPTVRPVQPLYIALSLGSIDSKVPNMMNKKLRFRILVVPIEDAAVTSNEKYTFVKFLYGMKHVSSIAITIID